MAQQEKAFDAFAYYSNDLARMKTLLMKDEDDVDVNVDGEALPISTNSFKWENASTKRNTSTNDNANDIKNGSIQQQQATRKTRLSFELHPSLIMLDLMFSEEAGPDQDVEEVGILPNNSSSGDYNSSS